MKNGKDKTRQKVLVISSYKTRCGVAAFAETLVSALESSDYEIEVFALDQFLLRNAHKRPSAAADRSIEELCNVHIPNADIVNLQWEPGLLGRTTSQICKRLAKITQAVVKHDKPFVLTAHTVILQPEQGSPRQMLNMAIRQPVQFAKQVWLYFSQFSARVHRILRKADKNGDMITIVHTDFDRRFFRHVVGLNDVRDHPLSLIRQSWLAQLNADNEGKLPELKQIAGSGRKYIVTFGFLTPYKGIETVIQAMRHLPDEYSLLIYGGVHPANIRDHVPVDRYVSKLMKSVAGDKKELQRIARLAAGPVTAGSANGAGTDSALLDELYARARPLTERVHFADAPDDYELAQIAKAADVCVFAHQEIGQSASGVATMAVELGKRTVLSRSRTFTALGDYYPGRVQYFEIGNPLQLAQTIEHSMANPEPGIAGLPYDNATLGSFYADAFASAQESTS